MNRHPNSCLFIKDLNCGGVDVCCGYCDKTNSVDRHTTLNDIEDDTNPKCIDCNQQLIYPDGASW